MIIKLANGTELTALGVTGEKLNVQGARRDVLSFIFPAETSLDKVDAIFTAENCKTISIKTISNLGEEVEHIHTNYTIRAELKREPVQVAAATDTTDTVYENRVIVAMGQLTYAESQIASLTETVDLLVMENLMA